MAKREHKQLSDSIVSLILVTKNDEKIIEVKLNQINKALQTLNSNYEIVIVDNASEDETISKIKGLNKIMPHIRILILSKTLNTEIALTAGLDNCVGDIAVLFNIKTDPTEIIPQVISQVREGNDIVIGQVSKQMVNHGFITKSFIKMAERISQHGFSHRSTYLTGLNRRAINSITRTRRKSRNFSYLQSLIGLKRSGLIYKPESRIKHESFFEILSITLDAVISNSFRPLRWLTMVGMIASLLFIIYVLGVVIIELVLNIDIAPKGWITISTVLGIMFFVLFSVITIISEYIIRILDETRNEPLYFVAEEIDKSVLLPEKDLLNIS